MKWSVLILDRVYNEKCGRRIEGGIMEVILGRYKSGDVMVMIRFEEDTNFNREKLEWIPRLAELELINKAMEKSVKEKKS